VQARVIPNDAAAGPLILEDVASLTPEVFNKLTSNGTIFVVRGAARLPNLYGWNCTTLKSHPLLKDAEGELLYADGVSAALGADWESKLAKTNASLVDKDAPPFGALRVAFRDFGKLHLEVPGSWTVEMIEHMKDVAEAPHFMNSNNLWRENPDGAGERESLHTSSELWLSPPKAGAQARLDPHLAATMALQLAGSTRWRLSQVAERSFASMIPEYQDGGEVYTQASDGWKAFEVASTGQVHRQKPDGWKPQYLVVLEAGDALFYPPGIIHEELSVGDVCSLSLTHQYTIPMPARYYRRNLRRFRHCGDLFESWSLMENWARLGGFLEALNRPGKKINLEGLLKYAYGHMWNDTELSAPLQDAFNFLDVNEDGLVTFDEVKDAALELNRAATVGAPDLA